MDDDIRQVVADAAGPTPEGPDLGAIRSGARRRRRTRTAISVAAAVLLAAMAVTTGLWLRPGGVEVISPDPTGLVAFDATTAVSGAASKIELSREALAAQPTRMLAGYERCVGPRSEGEVTVTAYCGPAGEITLRTGPHHALQERGDRVRIGDRIAWFERSPEGVGHLTLSDRDSMADTHYRLEVPQTVGPGTAAAILSSVPIVRESTGQSPLG